MTTISHLIYYVVHIYCCWISQTVLAGLCITNDLTNTFIYDIV